MQTGDRFVPHNIFVGMFIPNSLAQYKCLSPYAKLVWGRLAQYAGTDGVCFPKVDSIAEELGCDKRTVQRAIKELCKEDFLEVESVYDDKCGGQKTNRYYFLWHRIFDCRLKRQQASVRVTTCHGGGGKMPPLGATYCHPLYDKMPPKENHLKENQKKTSTTSGRDVCHTTGCSCSSDEFEELLKKVAPSKSDPEAWAANMRIRRLDGRLDFDVLKSQANRLSENQAVTPSAAIEKMVLRDGLDAVSAFLNSVSNPAVKFDGITIDTEYARQIVSKLDGSIDAPVPANKGGQPNG